MGTRRITHWPIVVFLCVVVPLSSSNLANGFINGTLSNKAGESTTGTRAGAGTRTRAGKQGKRCNIYDGRWVYDESYPMYDSSECPHIRKEFDCQKYGRPDHEYLKYRWQPHSCNLPRFNGKDFLNRLRGKKIMFVGDSVSLNHWQSLVCLLHAALPQSPITMEAHNETNTIVYKDFDVSISVFHSVYLVDIEMEKIGRVLKLNSMKNGETWKQNDVLIFNTWLWWYRRGPKQPWDYVQYGSKISKDMNRMVAFYEGLNTWVRWFDSNVDPRKTKVFFQGVSPFHYNGSEWHEPEVTNCGKETTPLLGSSYPTGLPLAAKILERVIRTAKKPVDLLDITTLSQLRKDGHPSSYNGFKAMDCTHWCVAGVPDTWNQLLYASLI